MEILKALYRGADILILDEPTAVLTPQEAHELFEIVRSLQADGKSIIFISHKLNEVLEIADRITVLRRGKKIETVPREGATEASLARAMVGREVLLRVEKTPTEPGDVLLSVEDLHVRDERGIEKVRGVSFDVRAGEIVGIAGVDGNGQTELIDAITGLMKIEGGTIKVAGRELREASARADARRRSRAHPRGPPTARPRARVLDRREHRAARLREAAGREVGLAVPDAAASSGPRRLIREFDVRGGGPLVERRRAVRRQPAEGRRRPRDRTRPEGADRRAADPRPRRRRDRVSAPADRHRARRGARVLLVSLELEEIFSLSDRILVHLRGRDRRRAHRRGLRAGDRPRDARRAGAPGGVSVRQRARRPSRPSRRPEAETGTLAARFALKQRAGGVIVPRADGAHRVPARRARRARNRAQPAARLPRHLQRGRPQLDLPSDDGHRVDATPTTSPRRCCRRRR